MNPEWLRKDFSKLESTLRLPQLVKFGLLILVKLLLTWLILSLLIGLLLGLLLTVLAEMFFLKRRYEKKLLPKHLANLEEIKKIYHQGKNLSKSELINAITKSIKLSSWGTINIAYVGLASWGWEYIFKWFYPLIVQQPKYKYHDLLIGFNNKSVESDQALWQVAQEKDKVRRVKKLESYLDKYGSRVEDLDLALPTFREQKTAIDSLLKLYSQTKSPKTRLEQAKKKRKMAQQEIIKNLRIPKSGFNRFLKMVQQNVRLREDRRFYEFLPDYYLRQMIILLGKKIGVDNKAVFNKSWRELKNAA